MKKKIFALTLVLAIAVSLLASCSLTKTPVSVLWSDYNDPYLFTVADAIDRAFYNQNIKHEDLDAKGDATSQIAQAERAVNEGAPALVVNPVSLAAAEAICDMAKAKDIPVVFICTGVQLPDEIFEYKKAAYVNVNFTTLWDTLGNKIAEDIIEDWDAKKGAFKTMDRDRDGRLSMATFGTLTYGVVNAVNSTLDEKREEAGLPEFVEVYAELSNIVLTGADVNEALKRMLGSFNGENSTEVYATDVEIIVTDDDSYVPAMVMKLREYGLNSDRLVTHCLPLYTVGHSANASELLSGKTLDEHTEPNKKGKCDNCGAIIEEMKAYSVMNAIDDGYVAAAALENDDAIAEVTALLLRNMIKEYAIFKDIKDESYTKNENKRWVEIPYTVYG